MRKPYGPLNSFPALPLQSTRVSGKFCRTGRFICSSSLRRHRDPADRLTGCSSLHLATHLGTERRLPDATTGRPDGSCIRDNPATAAAASNDFTRENAPVFHPRGKSPARPGPGRVRKTDDRVSRDGEESVSHRGRSIVFLPVSRCWWASFPC